MMCSQISLVGSLWFSTREAQDMAEMAGSGALDLSVLEHHIFPLDQINEALDSIPARHGRFNNFIFQAPTGEVRDGLPVYAYHEGKANYYGFELQADSKFGKALGVNWGGELVTDAVRASIKGFGPAPLIPPLRVISALTGSRGQVDGRIEIENDFAHNRTAPVETDTAGFTLVNASFDYHPFAANPELTLSLQGNNLFDVDARRSTSILKDYEPLAGRDIRLSARVSF